MKAWMDAELEMLDEMALDFACRELADGREERDRYPFGPFFDGVLEKAAGAGFFSVMTPEELGGAGKGIAALCLLLDDLCREDASLGGIIFTDALAKEVVLGASAEALALEALKGDGAVGTALVAAPAFMDTSTGLALEAVRGQGAAWKLGGRSEFVALGGLAEKALLPAAVEGSAGFSYFLVDLAQAGVEAGGPVVSLGLHACPAADLVLRGAEGRLVGTEGDGAACFERAADRMYAAAAAMACGVMKGSFGTALDYTRTRRQGGREIVNWSEVRRILAGMAVKVRTADMLVAEACRAAEEDEPGWRMGTRAASLLVRRMACELTTDGIQLLGGNGYMEEYGQEKRFRDARQISALLGSVSLLALDYARRVVEGEPAY